MVIYIAPEVFESFDRQLQLESVSTNVPVLVLKSENEHADVTGALDNALLVMRASDLNELNLQVYARGETE